MKAERFEQAGAFAGGHSRQLLIPLPQRLHHLLAPSRELGDLRVHGGHHALRGLSHALARSAARLAHAQERGDVAKGKPELLCVADYHEPVSQLRGGTAGNLRVFVPASATNRSARNT
jgi:hypothetical protein